ncbi:MAG TPA: zinc ribbon domain-containing protein [Gemmataceae bacterium]|nr:zinc ribbon domain-containing protein [Gemmataceae bacterium]
MAVSVTCNSCGKVLQLPEDFRRPKIRCPDCGVYCEVGTAAVRGGDRKKAPADSDTSLSPPPEGKDLTPRPGPVPKETEKTATNVAFSRPPGGQVTSRPTSRGIPKTSKKKGGVITCTHCGELVRLRSRQCPNCGTAQNERPKRSKPTAPVPVRTVAAPQVPAPVAAEDEEGPYQFGDGAQEIHCPECRGKLPANAALCVHCGFDLQSGEKAKRVYEKIERCWESNMSLRRRKTIYIISQAIILPLMLATAFLKGEPFIFIVPWLTFSVLLAFLLGTFDRIDLKRNTRGQVQLSKSWRVCFFERAPLKVVPWEYEGIKIMRSHNVQVLDIIMLVMLGVMGVIPGILWWKWSMSRATYYVAMTRDHGFPELALYHGGSEDQMQDIAHTLCDATGLPCQQS